METSIIVAVVAGLVSLISVFANIYIAYQAKKAALLQPKIQSAVSRTAETNSLLKNYAADIERLRIRIWNLLGRLGEVRLNENPEASYENLKNAYQTFIESADTFENAWAPVKGEMPEGVIHYVRAVRHECRSDISAARANMKELLSVVEGQPKDGIPTVIGRVIQDLKLILQKLDDLISLITAVRNNITEELKSDVSAKPNKSLKPTAR